ncbi:unnamed protein product [Brassica oleracea var. botrytis]
MGNESLFFADLKLADVLSPWSSISGNSFEHHVTLMEATVECSLGQSRWKPSSVLNHLDFFSPAR